MTNTKFRTITLSSMAMIMAGFSTSTFMAIPSFAQTANPVAPPPKLQQEELKTPVLLDGQKIPVLLNGQKFPVLLDGQKTPVLLNPVLLNPAQSPVISTPNKNPVLLNGQNPPVQPKPAQQQIKPAQQAPIYQYQAPVFTPTIVTPVAPVVQKNQIKAAFVALTNKKHYFFTNKRYFRYGRDVGFDKAANIKGNWNGIPDDVDAAFVLSKNKKAYFFKGSQYYRYDLATNGADNPMLRISRFWKGVPSNVDAAVEHPNGKIYFFKGDQYFRYDLKKKNVDKTAKISRGWPGVPNNVDAALLHANGKIYFFKGNKYYRFNIETNRADRPRNIGNPGYRGLDFTKKNFTKKTIKSLTNSDKGTVTQILRRQAAFESGTTVGKVKKHPESDSGLTCTTESRKFKDARIDHFLNSSNSVLEVPGNIMNGNDLFTGRYNNLNVGKNSYKIFIDIAGSDSEEPNSIVINNPNSPSELAAAVNELKRRHLPKSGRVPKNSILNISIIESEMDAKLTIGGSFKSPFVDVAGLYDFTSNGKTKKYLLEYASVYYTIRLEKQSNILTKTSVKINPNWVYVDEVKYGKRYLFALETNEDIRSTATSLDVEGRYGASKATFALNSLISSENKATSIKQISQGGSIIDVTGAFPNNITKQLAKDKYSQNNPGAPVSSILRFVSNNDIAQVATTADYTQRVCFRTSNVFKINLDEIYCQFQDDGWSDDGLSEVFGSIDVYVENRNGKRYTPTTRNFTASETWPIWWLRASRAISVGNGSSIPINQFQIFRIPPEELQDATLFIAGHLEEYDSGSGNDLLGRVTLKIDLKNVTKKTTYGGEGHRASGLLPRKDPVYSADSGSRYYVPVTIEPIVD